MEHLGVFKNNFPAVKVTQFANCLIYRMDTPSSSEEATRKANELIIKLGLPLIAENSTFKTQNSFIVKAARNENIKG